MKRSGSGDMKIGKSGIAALLCTVPWVALAAGGWHLLDARSNLDDKPSLQRGARTFVNYCLGCHSLQYMRYDRMGRDLGISDALVAEHPHSELARLRCPVPGAGVVVVIPGHEIDALGRSKLPERRRCWSERVY